MPRRAPKMTKEDFRSTVSTYAETHDFETQHDILDYGDVENIIVGGLMDEAFKTVLDDVSKIKFDFENTQVEKIVTFDSGVTVALVMAGGDWEYPLYFAFYYDGKRFRGYLPTAGNVYNHTTKEAYGNGEEEEDDADALKHYGVSSADHSLLNVDLTVVMAEIEARIEARGEYVASAAPRNFAAERRARLTATEPDLTELTEIGPELVKVAVMPAAGGSYFEVLLRHSGRELTASEAGKVANIPPRFKGHLSYPNCWYSPDGMSSLETARILLDAGFMIDNERSFLEDYRVQIYPLRS